MEACHAMGMTTWQTLRRIVIPEALTVAFPSLINSFIGLIKGTSLAFTCAVVEMTAQAKILGGRDFRYFEAYVALAVIYWFVTFILEQISKYVEKDWRFQMMRRISKSWNSREISRQSDEEELMAIEIKNIKRNLKTTSYWTALILLLKRVMSLVSSGHRELVNPPYFVPLTGL